MRRPIIPAPSAFSCSTDAVLRSTLPLATEEGSPAPLVLVSTLRAGSGVPSPCVPGEPAATDASGATVCAEEEAGGREPPTGADAAIPEPCSRDSPFVTELDEDPGGIVRIAWPFASRADRCC